MTFEEPTGSYPGRGLPDWVTIMNVIGTGAGWRLFLLDSDGKLLPQPVDVAEAEVGSVNVLSQDGGADSARVLAGLWTQWMAAAGAVRRSGRQTPRFGTFKLCRTVIDGLSDLLGTVPVAIVNSGHGLQPYWAVEQSEETPWPDEKDPRFAVAVALRDGNRDERGPADEIFIGAGLARRPGSRCWRWTPCPAPEITERVGVSRPTTSA